MLHNPGSAIPKLPGRPCSCCYLSHPGCVCRRHADHAKVQCNKRAQSRQVLTKFSLFPVWHRKRTEKPGLKERSALLSVFFWNKGKIDLEVRTLPSQGLEWVVCGCPALLGRSRSAILVRKVAFCYRCPETRGETLRRPGFAGCFSVLCCPPVPDTGNRSILRSCVAQVGCTE